MLAQCARGQAVPVFGANHAWGSGIIAGLFVAREYDHPLMLWVKSLHIIAVITWFAGLFYLPRLFVHHAMTSDEAVRERFKIMERKLYRGIMTPSLVMTLVFGAWLYSFNPAYYGQSGWMHAKLACVALLVGYHGMCRHYLNLFRDDRNTRSHVYFRWFNEFPTLLLVAIVILVVVKPF